MQKVYMLDQYSRLQSSPNALHDFQHFSLFQFVSVDAFCHRHKSNDNVPSSWTLLVQGHTQRLSFKKETTDSDI